MLSKIMIITLASIGTAFAQEGNLNAMIKFKEGVAVPHVCVSRINGGLGSYMGRGISVETAKANSLSLAVDSTGQAVAKINVNSREIIGH